MVRVEQSVRRVSVCPDNNYLGQVEGQGHKYKFIIKGEKDVAEVVDAPLTGGLSSEFFGISEHSVFVLHQLCIQ